MVNPSPNNAQQGQGSVLGKAPAPVYVICATVFGITIIVAIAFLVNGGKDASTITGLVNTIFNFLGIIFAGTCTLFAGAAAKQAQSAAQNTNGALDERIRTAVRAVLNENGVGNGR